MHTADPAPTRRSSRGLAFTVLVVLAGWSVEPGPAHGFSLGVRVDIPTGSLPASVALEDMDRDGALDLIVCDAGSNAVSVILGNGSGGSIGTSQFAMGTNPASVAVRDLNGDQFPDVVTANYLSQNVSVRPGGPGGLGARSDFTTGSGPYSVAIGDFNGDGRPDLAVANNGAATVSVLLNTTSGTGAPPTFGPKTDFPTQPGTQSVAVGDLNLDGQCDIAVAGGTLSVLLGDGTGTFGPRTEFTTGTFPYSVALGDLDNDGRLDAATANFGRNSVSVLPGNGSGGFGPRTDYPTGAGPNMITIGDANGDGRPDLVTANYTAHSVSVLDSQGGGTFGAKADHATGSNPGSVALGDLNGDGLVDLVATNGGSNTVSLLLGNGTGLLRARVDFSTGPGPTGVAAGDLTGDGRPDLVTSNYSAGTATVLVNSSSASSSALSFNPGTSYPTGAGATSPQALAIAGLNASFDGHLDVAVANTGTNKVAVLLGDGAGGLGAPTEYATGAGPNSVIIADVSLNNTTDLVTANYLANSVSVLTGNGFGVFAPKADFATGSSPVFVAVGDLNGDSKPDIVTANSVANTVSVLQNTSCYQPPLCNSLGFAAHVDLMTGNGPYSVAISDLDGDGRPDLAVANNGAATVSVLLNTTAGAGGPPTFAARTDFPTPPGTQSVAIGDVNGDDRADLIVAGGKLSILLGDGTGGFGPRTESTTGTSPYSVALADLNADDRLDAATANFGASTVSVVAGRALTRNFLTMDSPARIGAPLSLHSSVSERVPAGGAPSDSVWFFDGTTLLGTGSLLDQSVDISVTPSVLGEHVIRAVYRGDDSFLGSVSAARILRVLPGLSINDVAVTEGNAGTVNATMTLTLSNPVPRDVTVHYATEDGSATTANNDYGAASGSVTIPAHALSAPLSVIVKGDVAAECNERFLLRLSDAVNAVAQFPDDRGAVNIVSDDGAGPGCRPRIALHVRAFPPAGDCVYAVESPPVGLPSHTCTSLSPLSTTPPTGCSGFQTKGQLGTCYLVYLVAVQPPGEGLSGLSCGIQYDGVPHRGIDVLGWQSCSTLEFQSLDWPASGGGDFLAWDRFGSCQNGIVEPDGVHAVAGAFIVYAWSADTLRVTANPIFDAAEVIDCTGRIIEVDSLLSTTAQAVFSAGAASPGYNPCQESVAGLPENEPGPPSLSLAQSVPNPLRRSTRISYTLSGDEDYARLQIFDLQGRLVRTLVSEQAAPGQHDVDWDSRDQRGHRVAAGLYFYRLETAKQALTRRLIVLE